jgi:hypothetical protein
VPGPDSDDDEDQALDGRLLELQQSIVAMYTGEFTPRFDAFMTLAATLAAAAASGDDA